MDAGLSNLWTLKLHLLPEKMRARPDFDDALLSLGRGTAALMQRHCSRLWPRVVGDTYTAPAGDKTVYVLPRYPVEGVTEIAIRARPADPWDVQDLSGCLARVDEAAGIVILEAPLGIWHSIVRITYTGGYWWSTTEPPDTESQPSGSTAAPHDLVQAWLQQCEHVWGLRDRIGAGLVAAPGDASKLQEADLTEAVRSALRPFLRHG